MTDYPKPSKPQQIDPERWVWHRNDLGYTIRATTTGVGQVGYEIFEQIGVDEEDGSVELLHVNAKDCSDTTEDLDKAMVFVRGRVKNGGESWFVFPEQLYGDYRKHLANVGDVLTACWDWTADLLDWFGGD